MGTKQNNPDISARLAVVLAFGLASYLNKESGTSADWWAYELYLSLYLSLARWLGDFVEWFNFHLAPYVVHFVEGIHFKFRLYGYTSMHVWWIDVDWLSC